jgi:PAS domain-containing protein
VAEVGWYAPGLENGLFTFATMLTIAALIWWQVLTLYGEQSKRLHLQNQTLMSEQRYAELVQAVTDYAIYTLDAEGRVSSWNSGAEKVKGLRG